MKWPWVSRDHLNAAERELQAARIFAETWYQCFKVMDAQYEALLEKYHELVTEAKILPVSKQADMPERSPSLIDQVIREQAPTDPRLKAHLRSYASKLKRDGKSEGDIVLALTAWSTTEPLLTE